MRKMIRILVALSLVLALSAMAVPAAAASCNATVELSSNCAGKQATYTITFTAEHTLLPANDKISVDFAPGTDLSAVTEADVTVNGTTVTSVYISGTYMEFPVPAAMGIINPGDPIEVIVGKVVNPATPGSYQLALGVNLLCCGAFDFDCGNSTTGAPEDYDTLQQFFHFYGYGIDVANDELGIEMFPPGCVQVTVLDGLYRTGYDNPTGFYTSEEQIYLLFPDRPEAGDRAIFIASESFGFYIDSGDGRFYTETELNPDDFDHAFVYRNTKGAGYIVAFEDLWDGGDINYIDRILEVVLVTSSWSFGISPQEATTTAGESQNYTVVATDDHGVAIDVTAATLFTIDAGAGGQWLGNTYTSEVVGEWTVTGTCGNLTDSVTLIVTTPYPEFGLTISSTSGGSVTNPDEGNFTYEEGTVVDLEAKPDEGYQFVEWSGDVETIGDVEAASTTITMNDDYSITATFEEIPPVPTGCFVATAAYGTAMANEIQILREFRDEYLLTNPLGQGLVDIYYSISPPIADFITEHPSLKPIVRAGLSPVVTMCSIVCERP